MTLKDLKEALDNCSDNEEYKVVFETENDFFDIESVKVSKIRRKIILKESFGD